MPVRNRRIGPLLDEELRIIAVTFVNLNAIEQIQLRR